MFGGQLRGRKSSAESGPASATAIVTTLTMQNRVEALLCVGRISDQVFACWQGSICRESIVQDYGVPLGLTTGRA